jgi:hypothetical protein
MANGEIYITVSNKSQNVGVGVAGGNNKIGITGDNSQYFSNEARKSAEQAAQSVEEAKATLEETKTLTEEAQASIVAATENAQEAIITTKEEAIEEVEELLSKGTVTDVQVNGASILSEGVANIPIATSNDFGVVKYNTSYGVGVTSANILKLVSANNASIDNKLNQYNPITPSNLDYAVKVGVTTNTKELTSEEKTNACNWLGAAKSDTALDKTQITNCLLEVPQNIKLELNDGVLTLKAGSKVIVPNGFEADGATPKFDEIVVTQDLSVGASSLSTAERGIVLINGGITLIHWASNKSGTSPTTQGFYYHTGENKFYRDGVAQTNFSFPIMVGDYTSQYGFNNIKHVFNGMGYFGSTMWVDKGVKVLFPNGRNEDGSLNNIEGTTQIVKLYTVPNTYTNPSAQLVIDSANGIKPNKFGIACNGYIEVDEIPTSKIPNKNWLLHRPSNLVYQWDSTASKYILKSASLVAVVAISTSTGVITSFQPNKPFRAVDYNDKSEISSWAMPSNKYIDLTLGASGSTYTAPANGWMQCACTGTAGSTYFELVTDYASATASFTGGWARTSIPVKKGDVTTVFYGGNNFKAQLFRFIYAEGEV